tara:strand:- start:213 stop:761 length:549 start_codon:yes stop_codon:yes gene_type:complete
MFKTMLFFKHHFQTFDFTQCFHLCGIAMIHPMLTRHKYLQVQIYEIFHSLSILNHYHTLFHHSLFQSSSYKLLCVENSIDLFMSIQNLEKYHVKRFHILHFMNLIISKYNMSHILSIYFNKYPIRSSKFVNSLIREITYLFEIVYEKESKLLSFLQNPIPQRSGFQIQNYYIRKSSTIRFIN